LRVSSMLTHLDIDLYVLYAFIGLLVFSEQNIATESMNESWLLPSVSITRVTIKVKNK